MPDPNVRYVAEPELGAELAGALVAIATIAAAETSARARTTRLLIDG
jgi:hypothetical protein